MIQFLPTRQFAIALAQARRDVESWNAIRPARVDREAQWAAWARDEHVAMKRSPDSTIKNLENTDEMVRLAAIALIVDYWPPREEFVAPCLRTAFDDPVAAVRGAALSGLLVFSPDIDDRTGWLERLLKAIHGSPPDEVTAQAKRAVEEGSASLRQFYAETMKKLAGDQLETMLQSRDAAESFLQSVDPKMRRAALFVVMHYWKPTTEFGELCEHFILHDPDTTVRVAALGNVSAIYVGTDDQRIGRLFAQLTYDEAQPIELRSHAYRMLYQVRGMPLSSKEKAWSPEFRFPDEVDWQFVDSFL